MNTKIYRLDGYIRTGKLTTEDLEKLAEAAAILAGGGLVAFPPVHGGAAGPNPFSHRRSLRPKRISCHGVKQPPYGGLDAGPFLEHPRVRP